MIKIVSKTRTKIVSKTRTKIVSKNRTKIVSKTRTKIASKTRTKIVLKNYNHNKKEMSFLKISDPTKRVAMVKEYLNLKKNIRDNLLSKRTGEQQLQTDLSKIFFNLLPKHKKLQQEKLRKNLNPLRKVSKIYQILLRFLHIRL